VIILEYECILFDTYICTNYPCIGYFCLGEGLDHILDLATPLLNWILFENLNKIHARRYFAEYIKSIGKDVSKGTIAYKAYEKITEIMHIDNSFDDISINDRKKQRQLVLKPKVDAYFE